MVMKNKPGRKPGDGYRQPAPGGGRTTKCIRFKPAKIEEIEERCLEESLRLRREVDFSEIVRRGVELALAEPLPDPVSEHTPCNPIKAADGGYLCLTCRANCGPRRTTLHCMEMDRRISVDKV